VNVQVLADPAGRLISASPTVPGARHDAGAAREHTIPQALAEAGITAFADTTYHGLDPAIRTPHRRSRHDRGTSRFTRASHGPRHAEPVQDTTTTHHRPCADLLSHVAR
jgi:hypothetical protein